MAGGNVTIREVSDNEFLFLANPENLRQTMHTGDSLATASQRRSVPTGYVRFSKLSRRLHEHCRPIRQHLGHSLHDFGGIIAGADYRIAA